MNNTPIDHLPSNSVAPRTFLRSLLIGEGLTNEQYLEHEAIDGYKAHCMNSLSCLLGVTKPTIRTTWGKSPEFQNTPEQYKLMLGYIQISGIHTRCAESIITGAYQPTYITPEEFIKYALDIEGLSTLDMMIRLSGTGFFNDCVCALMRATGFERKTVIRWGSDIRFKHMPREHGRILYYALEAMKAEIEKQREQAAQLVAA